MMWNAYGDQYLGCTQCCNWYKCFKDSRKLVDPCSKCLSISTNNAHVIKVNIVCFNRQLAILKTAENCIILGGSCYRILVKKFEMRFSKNCLTAQMMMKYS